jgi:hypothetical protein
MPNAMTIVPKRARHGALAAALYVLVLPSAAWGGRVAAMDVMASSPHLARQGVSLEAISRAVLAGAERNEWRAKANGPGRVLADYSAQGGKHRVSVTIDFDLTAFVIRYRGSHNMGYTEQYCGGVQYGRSRHRHRRPCTDLGIHPYYNVWVRNLANSIAYHVGALEAGADGPNRPSHPKQPERPAAPVRPAAPQAPARQ